VSPGGMALLGPLRAVCRLIVARGGDLWYGIGRLEVVNLVASSHLRCWATRWTVKGSAANLTGEESSL